jgi:gliding motility associated protien GldN
MLFRKVFSFFAIITLLSSLLNGQSVLGDGYDGVYKQEHIASKKPIPYAPIREADVMWKKRVWRVIDLREKINLPLFYPNQAKGSYNGSDVKNLGNQNLGSLLYTAATVAMSIRIYNDLPDDFSQTLTASDVTKKIEKEEIVYLKNSIGEDSLDALGNQSSTIYKAQFDPNRIKKILLKEEWFFDRQRSVLDVRILGIVPLYDMPGKGDMPLFLIYFPEAREALAANEVFNRQNSSERRSFDDIFWKRQFSSYIVKEENVYDRYINEYKKGMDALLESNRIKDDIIIFEHDLWEF